MTSTLETRTGDFRQKFSVDGLFYEFSATNGGPVTFRVIGGATNLKAFTGGSWEAWDEDVVQFRDAHYFRNGMPVLRHVVSLIAQWVRQDKPFLFHFEATDERKQRIYRYLIDRHGTPIAARYTHYEESGDFYFVRKQEALQ